MRYSDDGDDDDINVKVDIKTIQHVGHLLVEYTLQSVRYFVISPHKDRFPLFSLKSFKKFKK